MDEQDLDRDLDQAGADDTGDEDTEVFYWALKRALERTPVEPPPALL